MTSTERYRLNVLMLRRMFQMNSPVEEAELNQQLEEMDAWRDDLAAYRLPGDCAKRHRRHSVDVKAAWKRFVEKHPELKSVDMELLFAQRERRRWWWLRWFR